MGRKRKHRQRSSDSPSAERRTTAADRQEVTAAAPADIPLPPWLEAWIVRYGMAVAVCGLLALLVAIVFGQTLRHDFIDLDDSHYVFDNPHVRGGLSLQGIVWAFTQRHEANWHPLTWISHMLDCQMYGLWAGGHHLTSLLLHAATAILLFLVLRRMTGRLGCSALVAALFAIHPLRAESVAWVAERKDVLSGLFFMLTLWAYTAYVRSAFSWSRYLLVAGLFALGLMAKPMLVTLPLVLLLLDFWPLRRWQTVGNALRGVPGNGRNAAEGVPYSVDTGRGIGHGDSDVEERVQDSGSRENTGAAMPVWRLVAEKVPLMALAAASCVVTLWAQQEAMEQLDVHPLDYRAANALVSYGQYMVGTLWPANLAAYYPHPTNGWPALLVAASGLALLGISAAAVGFRGRFPYFFSGWFWFAGMLVPVIGLIQVGAQAMADRYTYLPQIGLFIALVWGADAVWRWGRLGPRLAWAAAAPVVLTLVVCAARQAAFWRDGETLWRHAIDCTTDNGRAYAHLGSILGRRGDLLEAIQNFKIAFQLEPNHAYMLNNYSITLRDATRLDEAIHFGQLAVQQEPEEPVFRQNLATTFRVAGLLDQAILEYRKLLELRPEDFDSRFTLAQIYTRVGRLQEAAQEYRGVLARNGDVPKVHFYLANALAGSKAYEAAAEEYRKALDQLGNSGEVWHNLGVTLGRWEKPGEAIEPLEKAVKLLPGNGEYRHDLALALLGQGKTAEAVEQLRQAVALVPSEAVYQRDFGSALMAAGNTDEALEVFRRLVAARPNDTGALNCLAAGLLKKGKPADAIVQYRAALRISAKDVEAQRGLGEALLGEDKADEAIGVFRGLLAAQPSDTEALNYLAIALLKRGKMAEAIEAWKKLVQIDPRDAGARQNLAGVLLATRRIKEAIEQLQQAVALAPANAAYRRELAGSLLRAGRSGEAIAQYRAALKISAADRAAQRGLGEALLADGKGDEALEVFRSLAAARPEDAGAHRDLGAALLATGRVAEAVEQMRQGLRARPADGELMNDLAWVLATSPEASLRNGKEAVQLAQQAVKLGGGKQPALLDTLAAAYAEAGQFPDAVATARDALQRATAQGNQHLVESLRKRIKLYGEGQPWRDAAAGTRNEPLSSGGGGYHDNGSHFPFCHLALIITLPTASGDSKS